MPAEGAGPSAEAGLRAADGRGDERALDRRREAARLHGDREVATSCARRRSRPPRSSPSRTSPTAATKQRPVAFVFNGGPGASSAFLHMGAVGPQRVDFPGRRDAARAAAEARPERVVVARVHRPRLRRPGRHRLQPHHRGRATKKDEKRGEGEEAGPNEYFGQKRDLESLCEFMTRWLSENDRWGSPIFIAGESYGGYRVGRLVRMLQEDDRHRPERRDPHLAGARADRARPERLQRDDVGRPAADDGRRRGLPRAVARLPGRDVARRGARAAPRSSRAATTRPSSSAARTSARPSASGSLARLADFLGLPLELVDARRGARQPVLLRARAAPRRAQGRRLLRHHDHRHRSLPRPAGAGSDARPDPRRDRARVHGGDQQAAPLGDRRRDRPRVPPPQPRGEPGVEGGHEAALLRAAGGRDRLASATGCRSTRT